MSKKVNIYDILLFIIIVSLAAGNLGGGFQPIRVLAILFFPFALVKGFWYTKLNGFIVYFVCFLVFASLSLLWTSNFTEGLKELVYYLIHFLLFLEILTFARYSKNNIKTISFAWFVCICICLSISSWELITGNHLEMARETDLTFNEGGVIVDRFALSCTFGNYNGYVTFLCFAFPVLIYFKLLDRYSRLTKYIIPIVLLVSLLTVTINGSRGGVVSMSIMLLMLFVFSQRTTKKYIILVLVLLIGGFIFVSYYDVIMGTFMLRSSGGASLTTDEYRFNIWSRSFELYLDSFFIGTGVGSIIASLDDALPHNLFLEALVQYGIFALLFFSFLFKTFLKGIRNNDRNKKIFVWMFYAALPFMSVIDSGYLLAPYLYAFFATFYIIVYLTKTKAQQTQMVL